MAEPPKETICTVAEAMALLGRGRRGVMGLLRRQQIRPAGAAAPLPSADGRGRKPEIYLDRASVLEFRWAQLHELHACDRADLEAMQVRAETAEEALRSRPTGDAADIARLQERIDELEGDLARVNAAYDSALVTQRSLLDQISQLRVPAYPPPAD